MHINFGLYFWLAFLSFIVIAIILDLCVLHRKREAPSVLKSSILAVVWFMCAMIFAGFIYKVAGARFALEFITGYIIELSLSMDNVFIFILIFSYFAIPLELQHRVLFWGILGAIVMRLLLITLGLALINSFSWIFYLFGILLIYSSYKIVRQNHNAQELADNKLIAFMQSHLPLTKVLHDEKFFVKIAGKWHITPLFFALLFVEKADLIFALDSVPAILAVTKEPFIVFTSNIFAIIGLRTLYFLLAHLVDRLKYIKYGLSVILCFIGIKMILSVQGFHIPIWISLSIVILSLGISSLVSLLHSPKS